MQSQNSFTAPLRIILQVTPITFWILDALHLLLAVIAVSALPLAWSTPLVIAVIGVSAYLTKKELLAAPRAFKALLYDSDGQWWLTTAEGLRLRAYLKGAPLCAPYFIVLPLAVNSRRFTIVIAAESAPADLMRRLRVRLRYARSTLSSRPTTTSGAV
ncbi:MAG: protein YgfX [Gammaproteobacteria bacterium]